MLVKPCPSTFAKLKAGQHVTDGMYPELCIIQPTGTGGVEWGQLGFEYMKVLQATVINVNHNQMSGITSDFFKANKILKN